MTTCNCCTLLRAALKNRQQEIGIRAGSNLAANLLIGTFASSGVYDGTAAIASVNFANYGTTPLTDGVAPALVSAGTLDKAVVGVRFSEPVTKASATVLANYSVTQGAGAQAVVVTAAKMGIGADAVYLTVTGLTNNVFIVKVIGGVQDVAGNTIAPNTQVVARALNWNHADIGYFKDTTIRPSPGDDPYNIGQAVMVSSDENPEIEIIGDVRCDAIIGAEIDAEIAIVEDRVAEHGIADSGRVCRADEHTV